MTRGFANGEQDWLTEKLDKAEFRNAFNQERAAREFQDQLQSVLEQGGLTRKDLADRLGKSGAFISQCMRRGHNLTIATMSELASACGFELHVLLRRQHAVDAGAIFSEADWSTWDSGVRAKAVRGPHAGAAGGEIAHLREQRDHLQTEGAAAVKRARDGEADVRSLTTSVREAFEAGGWGRYAGGSSDALASFITHLREQVQTQGRHAHAAEALPRVAVAVIVYRRDGTVLTMRRKDGLWCHPGGSVEPDENVVDAAARELKEESGISVAASAMRKLAFWSQECAPSRKSFLVVWFRVVIDVGVEARLMEPDRFTDLRWCSREGGFPTPLLMGSASMMADGSIDPWEGDDMTDRNPQ